MIQKPSSSSWRLIRIRRDWYIARRDSDNLLHVDRSRAYPDKDAANAACK